MVQQSPTCKEQIKNIYYVKFTKNLTCIHDAKYITMWAVGVADFLIKFFNY